MFDITYNNSTIKYDQLGCKEDKNENFIAAGATKKLYIRIPTIISRTYVNRMHMTKDELNIEIHFKSNVITSGAVNNNDLELIKADLHLQYIELPDS